MHTNARLSRTKIGTIHRGKTDRSLGMLPQSSMRPGKTMYSETAVTVRTTIRRTRLRRTGAIFAVVGRIGSVTRIAYDSHE
jgi:hypothetical protein